MDGEFLSIVYFSGRVKVIKMPDVLNPISNQEEEKQDEANLLTPATNEEKPV